MPTTATAEMIPPTRERLRHVTTDVEPPVLDQKRARKAWRIVPIHDTMRGSGDIDADQHRAFARFEREWDTAHRMPSGVAKYGRSATNGTPVSQMLQEAMERVEFCEVRRTNAAARVRDALRAIPTKRCREALLMAVTMDTDLVHIGRQVTRYLNRDQARAAAVTLLQEAMVSLHVHYDPGD